MDQLDKEFYKIRDELDRLKAEGREKSDMYSELLTLLADVSKKRIAHLEIRNFRNEKRNGTNEGSPR